MPLAHEIVLAAYTLLPQQGFQFLVGGLYSLGPQYRLAAILGAFMRDLECCVMRSPELMRPDYLAHARHAIRSLPHWVWLSQMPDALFQVLPRAALPLAAARLALRSSCACKPASPICAPRAATRLRRQ